MLTEICAILHNYFTSDDDKHFGKFQINEGSIAPLDFLTSGQYFRIVGSKFNDGVYLYPAVNLTDEEFEGAIWAMNVPPAVIKLASDIKEYNEKNKAGEFTSESFGGYSYTRATDSRGVPIGWEGAFSTRLTPWRKM